MGSTVIQHPNLSTESSVNLDVDREKTTLNNSLPPNFLREGRAPSCTPRQSIVYCTPRVFAENLVGLGFL